MKNKLIRFASTCAMVTNFSFFAFAQSLQDGPSNYVVIGAFAIQNNAIHHVANARKLNFNPISEINPNRNLLYVYVLKTNDLKMAFDEASKIRKTTPYFDTWVYSGFLGANAPHQGSDVNPATKQAIAKIDAKDTPAVEEPLKAKDTVTQATTTPPQNAVTPDTGEKNFWFKIITAEGQNEVEGDVDVIDSEKTKKVGNYKGNQLVTLRPVNKSGNLSLVCAVFGYRKVLKDLNFDRPEDTPGTVIEKDQITIPFELVRLQKGDVAVMYDVFFYKDAAIMRPESRPEVESLTKMMKENLKYKIRINGHTNGNAHGKVISMGQSKNFFSLSDTKEGFGSAKKLSKERAELIRDFLVTQGIETNRMEIKAWGGTRPVYDKMSPQAQANVRVEIEILEDK